MLGMAACFEAAALGGKTRFSWSTDSIVLVAILSSRRDPNKALNRGLVKFPGPAYGWPQTCGMRTIHQRRASPHCMVVNLVRSGRKQPQLFFASAGGKARHPDLRKKVRTGGRG